MLVLAGATIFTAGWISMLIGHHRWALAEKISPWTFGNALQSDDSASNPLGPAMRYWRRALSTRPEGEPAIDKARAIVRRGALLSAIGFLIGGLGMAVAALALAT